MMKEIYLIRHGETEYNLKGIVQGSGIDSVLNSNGLRQAQNFYNNYKDVDFDLHVYSNLIRTKQTINSFLNSNIQCIEDHRIREICWGEHEGKAGGIEMMNKYYRVIEAWKNGDFYESPIGGESAYELGIRLEDFIKDLFSRQFNKALICTHGRTLRALVCLLKGWTLARMEEVEHSNTGLFIVRLHHNEITFLKENDLEHLHKPLG